MKKITIISAVLLFATTAYTTAQLRPSGQRLTKTQYAPNTGDADIDRHLQKINEYGLANFESFKKELATKFGVSNREINRIYPKNKLEPGDNFLEPGDNVINPGDVFYAYTLAGYSGKPVNTILEMMSKEKSWEKVTIALGIKPGSETSGVAGRRIQTQSRTQAGSYNDFRRMALSGIGEVK